MNATTTNTFLPEAAQARRAASVSAAGSARILNGPGHVLEVRCMR